MHISEIIKKIAIEITGSPIWLDVLNDSEPGHYGIKDWDVELAEKDIWVDIPNRSYNFNHCKFLFHLQLGSSNPEDGFQSKFSREAKGNGTFQFSEEGKNITIEDLHIEVDLDLSAQLAV
jgi:hypothetical protein